MPSAREYWAPNMLEAYELAASEHLPTAQRRFPELNEFKFATPKSERVGPGDGCHLVR
jgi:hypothetical protein